MTTGIPLLDLYIPVAVLVWLIYWVFSLTVRPRVRPLEKVRSRDKRRERE